MEDKNNLLITVLVVIAVVLGFLVYNKNQEPSTNNKAEETVRPSEEVVSQNDPGLRDLPASLSEEEKFVLVVPFDGTQEEKQKHFEVAESLAVSGNEIDIAGCLGTPLVLRISQSKDLRVKNSDSESHTMLLGANTSVTVEASETKVVKNIFNQGFGLYGYGCDQEAGTAGLFLVTE